MPHVYSLKEKRHIVKKITERTKNRFNVSIAEVGTHDEWRRAELGFAAVGNEGSFVNSVVDKVINFIEDTHLAELADVNVEVIKI